MTGPHQGRQHLLHADPGPLLVTYETAFTRNAPATVEPVTPEQRIAALRPSRYCPADRMAGFARSHFGRLPNELERVRAICTYAWEHLRYQTDTSGPATDAIDTLLTGHGACRDFAHLVAALCRAVDVPTRIAAVHAPGLSPMDFCGPGTASHSVAGTRPHDHPTAARRNKRRLWMPDDRHLAAGQISTADADGSLAATPDTAMRGTWTRTPPPDRQPTTAQPDVTFAVR